MLTRTARSCAIGLLLTGYSIGLSSGVRAQQTVGLFLNEPGSDDGYTLFAPLGFETTYLINNDGRLIHSWPSAVDPGMGVYLLDNGEILRATTPNNSNGFTGPGGRIERITWDGTLAWEFVYADDDVQQHHDFEPLPDGNILMIAWETRTAAEAIAAGRDPALLPSGELWPLHIIEVQPVGAGGQIVWEWHAWDHLIQEYDPTKANFGFVAEHPGLIDVNGGGAAADWVHANSIDYNPVLDQILVSTRTFGEIWIIDHGTTTAEASGHTGGRSGKGGDLLYRWGNPSQYGRGDSGDRVLFGAHDARWIEPGLPGAGNIMVFNNGAGRPGGNFSSVDELTPPVDGSGNYPTLTAGETYGPTELVWTYRADPASSWFTSIMCGAHRLPNGNTMITFSPQGNLLEVNAARDLLWNYLNPVGTLGPVSQGGVGTSVWRAHRYPANHPGLAGRDLTPGNPIELFNAQPPVPDGSGIGSPMTASRLTDSGDRIRLDWDAASCPAVDYNVIHGNLAGVATYALSGGDCAIGTNGVHEWLDVPTGDLYFLIVGVDETGLYESRWGKDSAGRERNGTSSSFRCAVTNKGDAQGCR